AASLQTMHERGSGVKGQAAALLELARQPLLAGGDGFLGGNQQGAEGVAAPQADENIRLAATGDEGGGAGAGRELRRPQLGGHAGEAESAVSSALRRREGR